MEDIPSNKALANAKAYVTRLLGIRLYSEQEIRAKLVKKKYDEKTIQETVLFFKQLDLIDDIQFARRWVSSRLAKPFGARRIRLELANKGIAPQLIDQELKRATTDYSEYDIVLELARKRARKYAHVPGEKLKQRIYGYLLRRGFKGEYVLKAVKNL